MKKIICYRIEYVDAHGVDSIEDGVITLKNGYAFSIVKTNEAEITEDQKDSDAGPYAEQSLRFSGQADSSFLAMDHGRLIFRVKTSDDQQKLFGSLINLPVIESVWHNMKYMNCRYSRQNVAPEFT